MRRAAAALGSDQVQVWTAAVPAGDADVAALGRTLSRSERARADRLRVAEPRRQFVAARALLRQLLGACLDVDPATLAFGADARGKPVLERPSPGDLRFNVSHTRSLVAVGLARGREVGVDVEWLHKPVDWSPLAARMFSTRELDELYALPEPLRREAFFTGWTRKEAYLKATGAGLTDDLAAIEVTLAPDREPRLLRVCGDASAAGAWTVHALRLPSGFVGAAVLARAGEPH